jgi:hypothetical protein
MCGVEEHGAPTALQRAVEVVKALHTKVGPPFAPGDAGEAPGDVLVGEVGAEGLGGHVVEVVTAGEGPAEVGHELRPFALGEPRHRRAQTTVEAQL